MRVLVCDDEQLARDRLKRLVEKTDGVEVFFIPVALVTRRVEKVIDAAPHRVGFNFSGSDQPEHRPRRL